MDITPISGITMKVTASGPFAEKRLEWFKSKFYKSEHYAGTMLDIAAICKAGKPSPSQYSSYDPWVNCKIFSDRPEELIFYFEVDSWDNDLDKWLYLLKEDGYIVSGIKCAINGMNELFSESF